MQTNVSADRGNELLLFALYSLATAFIGHRYWTMDGIARSANLYDLYKNVSIAGGFLLLISAGAGRYSIDHRLSRGGPI
jgi:putative oxidoreductase